MDEFIKCNPDCTRIRIFIPAKLDHFILDYRQNWKHEPVTDLDIDALEVTLKTIEKRNPSAILEAKKSDGAITQDDYDLRHNEEVVFSDEVYAFQVNNSTGTQDTIDKAKKAGLRIDLHKQYQIAA